MPINQYTREKFACAYFFGSVGLIYGIFTARMPAIKQLTQASDSQIGFLLLTFGVAGMIGMLVSKKLIDRFQARIIMGLACLLTTIFIAFALLAFNYWYLLSFCFLAGFGNGLSDVSMNAQGMIIEKRYHVLCMSSLHACFSLGGVLGSFGSSLLAACEFSPFINFIIAGCGYLLLWPWAFRNTISAPVEKAVIQKKMQNAISCLFSGAYEYAVLC